MAASKREWRKPQVVVLMRSHTEEAVLSACKGPTSNVNPGAACKNSGVACSLSAKS